MFTKVEPKLQGGVLIGLGVRCAAFNIPNARAISSPIMPMMAARGIRLVDFAELRRARTAIYVVVPAGHAPCSNCGKEYCRVCSRRCPKCGREEKEAGGSEA